MAGSYIYYCEITKSRQDVNAGVYKVVADSSPNGTWYPRLNRLVTVSERVWKQGPRGGVKVIKEPFLGSNYYGHKYQTTNPRAMKEFAWVKLQAKPL